jgi:hypothetical protein
MAGYDTCTYISPKSAGRMHCAMSLYGSTFVLNNRPMHKYVKEVEPAQHPKYVSSHEIWDFPIKLYQNIEILPGYSLEINCEVKMPVNGKIIVHRGANLIVNGGKITSAHDAPWQGIEVYGNSTAHQCHLCH